VRLAPPMSHLDLARAVICADCDAIFDVEDRACPRCAAEGFMPLAAWLDRIREEIVTVPWAIRVHRDGCEACLVAGSYADPTGGVGDDE